MPTQGPSAGASAPSTLNDYRIVHWTTAEGLPQNSVNDIVRLPNGELWLATFGGLARFDGQVFHVMDMTTDAGLPTHRIVSLAIAGPDAIWYLTQQGHLGRVQGNVASTLTPAATPSVDALALLAGRTGRLFFKAADGSGWSTDGTKPWERILRRGGPLQSLAESEDGAVWAVWGSSMAPLAAGPDATPVALPREVLRVFRRHRGGLWLGIGKTVAEYVDGTLTTLDVSPPLDQPVNEIEEAADGGELWVAAGNEVSRLNLQPGGGWQRRRLPLGLGPEVQVRALNVDVEGSLWIGTDGTGLFRVNRPPARLVGRDAALGQVSGLASDGRGGAFVVAGCRGVFHVDAADVVRAVSLVETLTKAYRPGAGCGTALAPGPAGTVWVRAGPQLFAVGTTTLGVRRFPEPVPFDQGPTAASADGGLWVVSRQGTVHLLAQDGRLVRQWSLPAPLVSASVAPDGALWIGGDGRVFTVRRDANDIDRVGPDEGVPRGLVRDVLVERDGTAWIGTYGGGVGRLRNGRVARLSVAQGLPDNSVSRILDDTRGRLWISTNRGIAVCEKVSLHAVADGRLRAITPVLFGTERGVSEANFGYPAGFVGPDGQLWFGTIEGAVRIDARGFPFNTTPPVVSIESVSADDRPLSPGSVIDVPPQTGRVRVGLAASSLLYPELIRFRFRVEGVDPDWVDVGPQRSMSWTPPGPGRHRVVFEARNEDGIWSSAPTVVEFDVQPAWWQRAMVRVAGGLVLALAVFAAFRWRVRAIERRHAEQLRRVEEQRAADERMSQLREQLEHVSRVALVGELAASLAHEVKQPIGAMVNNAEAGRRHLAKYLKHPEVIESIFRDIVADGMRASEIVRGVRGFLRPHDVTWSHVDLSELVREMLPLVRRELQDHHVEVDLALAVEMPRIQAVKVQLGQVVVNLVMNACEALAGVDGPRRVTIATSAGGGRVELAVSDNGPGPAPEVATRIFEAFVSTKPDGLGMGLAICRSIAEAHGGRLLADRPPDGGFRVVLSLPAGASGLVS